MFYVDICMKRLFLKHLLTGFFIILEFIEIKVELALVNEFTEELNNNSSPLYIELKQNITEEVTHAKYFRKYLPTKARMYAYNILIYRRRIRIFPCVVQN